MKFIDYTFSKAFDGNIIFDPDLKPEQLGVRNGDCFQVVIRDNIIVLEKKQYNE